MNDKDSLELRPLLLRLLRRGCWILLLVTLVLIVVSIKFRSYLQEKIAVQVTKAVRNDLLMGNSAAALKTLQPNIGEHFSRITYSEEKRLIFILKSTDAESSLGRAVTRQALCLDESEAHCTGTLLFEYSLLAYVPLVLLVVTNTLGIFLLIFWIFRQHVSAYYRVQLKEHQEAALGRLSARICHDLKIPSMIFQRAAYTRSAADFFAMQPLLQSHLQRLHRMIEKLKRADVEGLLQIESHQLSKTALENLLGSLALASGKIQIIMPESLPVRLDLEKFERSLANLVLNALQAGASSVRVDVEAVQENLRVIVENDGPPMTAAQVRNFMSRDGRSAGRGLGLEIVKDTVASHGGQHDLTSTDTVTRFTLHFPQAVVKEADGAPPPALAKADSNALVQHETLIYVDRDLLETVHRLISDEDRGFFHFTDNPDPWSGLCLVISRQDQSIEIALRHKIPILVAASNAADDGAWIQSLKSRLRLLNRARSLS